MFQQWICDGNLGFVHNKPKREKAAHNQVPHNGACIANERNFVAKMSLYKLPIQKCRIQRVRIGFSPYTNFVRVTPVEGPLDSGPLDSFGVTPIPPKF
jgi:hypothetical protein